MRKRSPFCRHCGTLSFLLQSSFTQDFSFFSKHTFRHNSLSSLGITFRERRARKRSVHYACNLKCLQSGGKEGKLTQFSGFPPPLNNILPSDMPPFVTIANPAWQLNQILFSGLDKAIFYVLWRSWQQEGAATGEPGS